MLLQPRTPAPPEFDTTTRFGRDIPPSAAQSEARGPWWRRAVTAELATPLGEALARNSDLAEARARIEAGRARVAQSAARRGPSVELEADAALRDASSVDRSDRQSARIDGVVPLDVSGALARRQEAAEAELAAQIAETDQVTSDLARDYLLATLDAAEAVQRSKLLERQTEAAQTLLKLIELRFTQGLSSSVDVLQQRDELASLRQQMPIARLDREQALNRLRLIGNTPPPGDLGAPTATLPWVSPGFVTAAPVELLQRRGGLRADGARLTAADANLAAAIADRLPRLDFSASAAALAASGDVTSLLVAALDATVTLFDSGNKRAIVDERRAQLLAIGQAYLGNWLETVLEADDLIREERSLRERLALSKLRLETAGALLDAAQRRYERGVSDYLPVLAALRGLQQQERDHLALRAELGRARVRLHHAIGDAPPESGP